jgi:hypothetical protein
LRRLLAQHGNGIGRQGDCSLAVRGLWRLETQAVLGLFKRPLDAADRSWGISAAHRPLALSSLLHIPMDDAVSLYAFAASLALELAGMAAMMGAEAPPDMLATDAQGTGERLAPSMRRIADGVTGRRSRHCPLPHSRKNSKVSVGGLLCGRASTEGRYMFAMYG